MKLFNIRNAFGLSFAILLAACGAGNEIGTPTQAAAMVETNVNAPAAGATQVASAAMPAPDCAADGCKGLRIIDANAEAFRYQAIKAGTPQS